MSPKLWQRTLRVCSSLLAMKTSNYTMYSVMRQKLQTPTTDRKKHSWCGTYTDTSFLLHVTGRVMKVGELYGHLVINRQQLFLAFFQLVLQSRAFSVWNVGRHRATTDIGTDWVKAMHRLAEVLVAILYLDSSLRLQHATSITIVPQPSVSLLKFLHQLTLKSRLPQKSDCIHIVLYFISVYNIAVW